MGLRCAVVVVVGGGGVVDVGSGGVVVDVGVEDDNIDSFSFISLLPLSVLLLQ